jgi:hypothetical protein
LERTRAAASPWISSAGAGAFATVGEEALVADRARAHVAHILDTSGVQPLVRDRTQIYQAPIAMGAADRCVNLLAYLVAAPPRTRADHRDRLPATPDLSQRAHALLEHPGDEPSPAGVQSGDRAVHAEHHRDAVGGEHHRREIGGRNRVTVGLERGLLGAVGLERTQASGVVREHASHRGPVHLIAA